MKMSEVEHFISDQMSNGVWLNCRDWTLLFYFNNSSSLDILDILMNIKQHFAA